VHILDVFVTMRPVVLKMYMNIIEHPNLYSSLSLFHFTSNKLNFDPNFLHTSRASYSYQNVFRGNRISTHPSPLSFNDRNAPNQAECQTKPQTI